MFVKLCDARRFYMAKSKRKSSAHRTRKRNERESLRAEYRTLIGRAIIAGLITHRGSASGLDLVLDGPDYDQDTGDYTQSGGGDHQQNSGNYTQSP
jgi:hypothetical protein